MEDRDGKKDGCEKQNKMAEVDPLGELDENVDSRQPAEKRKSRRFYLEKEISEKG